MRRGRLTEPPRVHESGSRPYAREDTLHLRALPHSASSRVCREEAEHAEAQGKRIVPIVRESLTPEFHRLVTRSSGSSPRRAEGGSAEGLGVGLYRTAVGDQACLADWCQVEDFKSVGLLTTTVAGRRHHGRSARPRGPGPGAGKGGEWASRTGSRAGRDPSGPPGGWRRYRHGSISLISSATGRFGEAPPHVGDDNCANRGARACRRRVRRSEDGLSGRHRLE